MKRPDHAAPARRTGSGDLQIHSRIHALVRPAKSGSKALEQLLAQIAEDRDQVAFARLYTATKGKLFSTALVIVRRWDLAEDVIQDVYARIWLNAHAYRPSSGSPMTWMITIARNLAIDTVRKSTREIHADDSELLALPSDGLTAIESIEWAEDQQAAVEQKRRVLVALQSLDPARRDLVIAAYVHGESRAQLSKRAGVPVNTVKTWIRRALLEVQAILRNTESESGPALGGTADLAGVDRAALMAPGRPARVKAQSVSSL